MRNFKKPTAIFLSATMMLLQAASVMGEETKKMVGDAGTGFASGIQDLKIKSFFSSFTGKVTEIEPFYENEEIVEGKCFVSVEAEDGQLATFAVTSDTFVTGSKIAKGLVVTGYYEENAPVFMIYPPRYNVNVVVAGEQEGSIKVDLFDKGLLSSDRQLKLIMTGKTVVEQQNGKAFEGDLGGRKMVVFYSVTTRSIPAQTTPEKVVVLYEKAVPPIYELTEELVTLEITIPSIQQGIVVEGQRLENANMQILGNNQVYVPLGAVAEVLGLKIGWNGEKQMVTVGDNISMQIGSDNYKKDGQVFELGAAPVIIVGRTYVPIQFFRQVVGLNNAYLFEGQAVINNGEEVK